MGSGHRPITPGPILLLNILNILTLGTVLLVLPPGTGPCAAASEIYLSPLGNDLSGDGSAARPIQTFAKALQMSVGAEEIVLRLAPGVYSRVNTGEELPIHIEPWTRLVISGPEQGDAEIRGSDEDALLEVLVRSGNPQVAIRIEGLRFEGGLTGVSVVGEASTDFVLEVSAVRFAGQKYQSLETVPGPYGSARAILHGNTLDGTAAFGIDLATREGSVLDVSIEENYLGPPQGPDPPPDAGSSAIPSYGVGLYLDVGATIQGSLRRNTILGAGSGILVLEEGFPGAPGRIDLEVSSCIIAGDASGGGSRLSHGISLAVWPYHSTDIRILHSTIAGARGFGIRETGPTDTAGLEELAALASLAIEGCIFQGSGAGEFGAEGPDGSLPAHYRRVRGNVLPRSSRGGIDGNIAGDADLGPGFEPAAGSPLVDAAEAPKDFTEAADARGACRLSDGDDDGIFRIDLGAIERRGFCARDARPFIRSDCDGNGTTDITDAVGIFQFLFLGAATPACLDACDTNDTGDLDISDGIHTLISLFLGESPPPAPYPEAGSDPTPDRLGPCP